MLEIVLLILKIAGIIFVSVLGILIVVACSALFVPARYRGDFWVSDGGEDGKRAVGAKLRAAWFLHLVRVYVSCEETARVRVKVLFFTLMDTAKEKRKKRRIKGKEEKTDRTGEAESASDDKRDDAAGSGEDRQEIRSGQGMLNGEVSEKEPPDMEKALNEGQKKSEISAERAETVEAADGETEIREAATGETTGRETETKETKERSPAEEGAGAEQRKSRGKKRPKGNDKSRNREASGKEKKGIRFRISKILQTIRNFCDKLKGIREKAEEIERLWLSDHMVSSRSLLGKQLRYLLKHTKPKKLAGYIRFGFEDPSSTGYAMAVYGILYSIWSPKLSVEPDFEKQVLDCHILIKGKIRVWHFVRAALRMLLSRDVRRVIKDVKKL